MTTSPSTIAGPETAEDALMGLMMALGRQLRQRLPGDAIDYSAFPLLKLLCQQGPMRVSALAHGLGLDASTVSRHVRQLEDRGLLERTGDPDDRRASRVAVTASGADVLAEVFSTRRALLGRALDDFTPTERDTLRLMLHRLLETVTAQPESSGAR
jgi:DNA-binding MarR family transcriptional regulator